MKKKLFLLRGTPGSGKSTLAKALSNSTTFHIEADMYFINVDGEYQFDVNSLYAAHKWCQEKTSEYLGRGFDVVVSNTFTTKKELKPYFEIGKIHGIIPQVIVCQNKFNNVHDVPQETLVKMASRFQYDISSLFETETVGT